MKVYLLFSSFRPFLEPGHEKQAVEGSRFIYCDACEILSENFGKTQNQKRPEKLCENGLRQINGKESKA